MSQSLSLVIPKIGIIISTYKVEKELHAITTEEWSIKWGDKAFSTGLAHIPHSIKQSKIKCKYDYYYGQGTLTGFRSFVTLLSPSLTQFICPISLSLSSLVLPVFFFLSLTSPTCDQVEGTSWNCCSHRTQQNPQANFRMEAVTWLF